MCIYIYIYIYIYIHIYIYIYIYIYICTQTIQVTDAETACASPDASTGTPSYTLM